MITLTTYLLASLSCLSASPQADSNNKLHYSDYQKNISNVAFSPDGETFVSVATSFTTQWQGEIVFDNGPSEVIVWCAESGKEKQRFQIPLLATCLTFSPDSSKLVVGGYTWKRRGEIEQTSTGALTIVDFKTGKQHHKNQEDKKAIHYVVVSTDGKRIASERGDSLVKIWDFTSEKSLQTIGENQKGFTNVLSYHEDKLLLHGGDRARNQKNGIEPRYLLYNFSDGKEEELTWFERTNDRYEQRLAVSANRKLLATGVYYSIGDTVKPTSTGDELQIFPMEIDLWDMEKNAKIATLKAGDNFKHNGFFTLKFSPDARIVATTSRARLGEIILWDIEKQRVLETIVEKEKCIIDRTAFSPNGKKLLYVTWQPEKKEKKFRLVLADLPKP